MHSELPLAVKQLLNITEQTSENESDWRLKTPTTIANTSFEEADIITKNPVAIQQHVESEIEVGCVCCMGNNMHEICLYISIHMYIIYK